MRWDLGIRMERKPVGTGTAGTREGWSLGCIAKPRPNALHLLAYPLSKRDALRHGGDHSAGKLGFVANQGIISRGHGFVDARLQISQVAQRADD